METQSGRWIQIGALVSLESSYEEWKPEAAFQLGYRGATLESSYEEWKLSMAPVNWPLAAFS